MQEVDISEYIDGEVPAHEEYVRFRLDMYRMLHAVEKQQNTDEIFSHKQFDEVESTNSFNDSVTLRIKDLKNGNPNNWKYQNQSLNQQSNVSLSHLGLNSVHLTNNNGYLSQPMSVVNSSENNNSTNNNNNNNNNNVYDNQHLYYSSMMHSQIYNRPMYYISNNQNNIQSPSPSAAQSYPQYQTMVGNSPVNSQFQQSYQLSNNNNNNNTPSNMSQFYSTQRNFPNRVKSPQLISPQYQPPYQNPIHTLVSEKASIHSYNSVNNSSFQMQQSESLNSNHSSDHYYQKQNDGQMNYDDSRLNISESQHSDRGEFSDHLYKSDDNIKKEQNQVNKIVKGENDLKDESDERNQDLNQGGYNDYHNYHDQDDQQEYHERHQQKNQQLLQREFNQQKRYDSQQQQQQQEEQQQQQQQIKPDEDPLATYKERALDLIVFEDNSKDINILDKFHREVSTEFLSSLDGKFFINETYLQNDGMNDNMPIACYRRNYNSLLIFLYFNEEPKYLYMNNRNYEIENIQLSLSCKSNFSNSDVELTIFNNLVPEKNENYIIMDNELMNLGTFKGRKNIKLRRFQFKKATPNNGKFIAKDYYYIQIALVVELKEDNVEEVNNKRKLPFTQVLKVLKTNGISVRGRNPSFYTERNDVSIDRDSSNCYKLFTPTN